MNISSRVNISFVFQYFLKWKGKGILKEGITPHTFPAISKAFWSLEVWPAMALIWMKLAPVRKGTQARMRRVSCQLWMKATMTAMPRAHTVLVAKPNREPAAWLGKEDQIISTIFNIGDGWFTPGVPI